MSPTSFQTALPRDKVGGGGFEPPKQFAADLQSVPFGHSGIRPYEIEMYDGTEVPATQIGLEPTTSAVTGRRSNQLSHWANCPKTEDHLIIIRWISQRGFANLDNCIRKTRTSPETWIKHMTY